MTTRVSSGQALRKHDALQHRLRLRLGCGEGLSSWLEPVPDQAIKQLDSSTGSTGEQRRDGEQNSEMLT